MNSIVITITKQIGTLIIVPKIHDLNDVVSTCIYIRVYSWNNKLILPQNKCYTPQIMVEKTPLYLMAIT